MKNFINSYKAIVAGLVLMILFYIIGFAVHGNTGIFFHIDDVIENNATSLHIPFVIKIMNLITNLGAGTNLLIIYWISLIAFIFFKQWKSVLGLMLGFWTIHFATGYYKDFFHRVRPEHWLTGAGGWSYPSGHTTESTIVLLFIAYALYLKLKPGLVRNLSVGVSLGLALLIGLSRIYLSVHWFSDVYGGIMFSLAFFLMFMGITSLFGKKEKTVELEKVL
jgi:undecaprenyl-diphosphatase